MSEESKIPLKDENASLSLGNIEISPDVIEIISGIAADEVDGVYAMKGTFKTGMQSVFGESARNKGVHLSVTDAGLVIDVYCSVKFGISVPKVALELQQKIKEQVLFMSDLTIDEINIHVVKLGPQTSAGSDPYDFESELSQKNE